MQLYTLNSRMRTSFDNPFVHLPVVSSPLPPSASNLTTRQSVPSSCSDIITPACLEALYGIPTTKATQSSNVLGVSGFIEQYAMFLEGFGDSIHGSFRFANQADLATFLENFRPDLSGTTFNLQTLDDGENPQSENEAGIGMFLTFSGCKFL